MRPEPPESPREDPEEGLIRRRFPRYPFQLPFRYRVHPVPANTPPRGGVGWTRQLSEGGAGVELGELLTPGWALTLQAQTTQGPREVQAQVVWSQKPVEGDGGILHGLVFTAVEAKLLHAFRDIFQVLNVFQDLSRTPRAGLRLPIATPAICQARYPPGPLLQSRTGNISRQGVLLLISAVMAPGTVLAVTLGSPQGTVSLEGVVVWRDMSARAALDEFVRHGVQLTTRDWAMALALGSLAVECGMEPVPLREPGGSAPGRAVE
ncbi:MAG TPA: PilZ domain-containing protein [Candidatus Methylomirabilis sp.]|nr:PilZ domain-containing protein [Candidatus Methylomirabilis sp.]